MAGIFISYRRQDSIGHAGRLYDRLAQHFGSDRLFMDIDTIEPGLDFVEAIEQAVGTCDVLLAIIGPGWLSASDASGHRRLDNPEDFVRLEIAAALERRVRVIPVLIQGVSMPRSIDLPDVLKPLARRHAFDLSDQRFHTDATGLIAVLERVVTSTSGSAGAELPATLPSIDPSSPSTARGASETSFTNSIGMGFILIPAGSFMMGAPDSDSEAEENEKPAHRVEISQPFYLGKYPATQAQWLAVMGENPSRFRGDLNLPVEQVSWHDVQAFVSKLNEREDVRTYSLPTEAQWEYACRAGTETPRYHKDIGAVAWYETNSNGQTHPVGRKLLNAWGLYDMLVNVWEWCHDGSRPYMVGVVIDPLKSTDARPCGAWNLSLIPIAIGSWVWTRAERLARHVQL